MRSVFKYTRNQFVEDAIRYGIFASHLDQVNDPYEHDGIQYEEDYRICCVTTANKQMLMWSYYVNHRGCCVEYEVDQSLLGDNGVVKAVTYTEKYSNHRYMDTNQIIGSLYKKGKEWENEKEIRAVWHKSEKTGRWNHVGNEVFLSAPVKSVCFGLLAELDEDYYRALGIIYNYNQKTEKKIAVKKLILSSTKYALEYDKQYDYEREFKKHMDSPENRS